ncbi:hypothetical protein AN958_09780 [Leucoagaricus sp. SymC.cos]|nr:hypothetical protein AN958_09780 [Leucoagaricus sp. SymC.cos]
MEFVFNPKNSQGDIRYKEFFQHTGNATHILNWWTAGSNQSITAKNEVHDWAVNYVQNVVKKEAASITQTKELQTHNRELTSDTVSQFSLSHILTEVLQ